MSDEEELRRSGVAQVGVEGLGEEVIVDFGDDAHELGLDII
jgi:hypothetical protein